MALQSEANSSRKLIILKYKDEGDNQLMASRIDVFTEVMM